MIGKKLSVILEEIENTLWEFEFNHSNTPCEYEEKAIGSAVKILMSVCMDKMWKLQENENLDFEDRCNMAEKLGNDIRNLVKTYTNIDTHKLYK